MMKCYSLLLWKLSGSLGLFLGHTALHCAILAHGRPQRNGNGYVNSLPVIEALVKAGADPNSQVSGILRNTLTYQILKVFQDKLR